jgi:hypothetical protein
MSGWIAPVLGFLGVLLGAYFARSRENEKARRDKLSEVYAKYLEISASSSTPVLAAIQQKMVAGLPLTEVEVAAINENRVAFINAHANILVYGSPQVVGALSKLYDEGRAKGGLAHPDVNAAMIALITAMRYDSDAESYVGFGDHADNIVGAKADQRAAQVLQGQSEIS